jgi:hypothetical protein
MRGKHNIFGEFNLHPLEGGYFRRKLRRQRRAGLPRENPLIFIQGECERWRKRM